jgi:hypothetical protein
MSPWLWLIGAAAAAAGAYLTGWPAWSAARARRTRDLNAERYLAWRGRAGPRVDDSSLTKGERQRLAVAALLGLVAAFCLVGFFTYL